MTSQRINLAVLFSSFNISCLELLLYFFQLSKVQCFNDFLQALKSKLEDKALSDFWEIMVQGRMAFKKN